MDNVGGWMITDIRPEVTILCFPCSTPHPVACRCNARCDLADVSRSLAAARKKEVASYSRYGEELSERLEAMQSVLMWNILWSPSEAGPWANVDRGWGQPYCLFDWDNLFASYMLSLDSPALSFSNLIQIVKSRVMAGFIPGYAKGLEKTRDRTEPPIGSKVVLEMYVAPPRPIPSRPCPWYPRLAHPPLVRACADTSDTRRRSSGWLSFFSTTFMAGTSGS